MARCGTRPVPLPIGKETSMPSAAPTCIDCDHAFELPEDASVVVCNAHQEYRDAMHPASCECYAPRKFLTESSVTEIWPAEAP